jgi:hypothetical protein
MIDDQNTYLKNIMTFFKRRSAHLSSTFSSLSKGTVVEVT